METYILIAVATASMITLVAASVALYFAANTYNLLTDLVKIAAERRRLRK